MNLVAECSDDVGAPLDRAAEKRRRERVVDDAAAARDRARWPRSSRCRARCRRVADRLAVERLGVVADRRLPRVGIVGIDPRQLDRHLAQQVLELVDRPAVERRRRDDVIAGREQREERRGLRRDAAGERDRAAAAFEVGHALLEDGDRRVHDPRVGVAVLLEVEVRRRRFRILEHVARRLIDRHRARAGVRIRTLARVHLTGFEAEPARFFHCASSTTSLPREELLDHRRLARFLQQETVVSVRRVDHVELDLLAGARAAPRPAPRSPTADRASRS